MALVNADYKFIYVDIGCQGRLSDGAVMRNITLTELLKANKLGLPDDRLLPDINLNGKANDSFLDGERPDTPLPYVMVADDAFALTLHCMKPYAQKGLTDGKIIYNYRLVVNCRWHVVYCIIYFEPVPHLLYTGKLLGYYTS